ncbi:tetratricopeptide repeat protein [Lacticaseibacillus paracasei]|nr:TPR repeat-containing protein [Lacticaseibacillus paracasei subsp. paracasei CNCM I-4649]RNE02238.1 putative O-linked N-acetylglucosamine transferase, SPINDLY family [Lacticaseibacillus paracasei]
MSSNDNNADHFNIQGNALVENGQYSEAISEYRRAITLNSKNAAYYNNLGGHITQTNNTQKQSQNIDKQ